MSTQVTHTVVAGETLSEIALRELGDASRYDEIARANGIANPNQIRVGQVLVIPVDPAQTAPVGAPDSRPAPVLSAGHQGDDGATGTAGAPYRFILPPGSKITSPFGRREAIPSIGLAAHDHPGVDLWGPGIDGWALRSPVTGVVHRAGHHPGGFGWYVCIDADAPGLPGCLMAHFWSLSVELGQRVVQGETVLGRVGSSGLSTGAHIHLELSQADGGWIYGQVQDPAPWIEIVGG